MIEFSCIYCGRAIQAEERLVGQRVKCPSCGHTVVACRKEPGVAPEPVPESAEKKRKATAFWARRSDGEIAECLLPPEVMTDQQRRRRALQETFSFLIPRYDDVTLFALSLSFVLLWLMDPDLQRDLIRLFTSPLARDEVMVVLVVGTFTATAGLLLSLINVFLRREKSGLEKIAMLVFAVLVTAGTGLYAGWTLLWQSKGWLLFFPIWNILNAYLLILSSMMAVGPECITDEPASFAQLVITAACVPALLAVCEYYGLHWAVTFSIVVAYTMSLHNGIRDVFGRRPPSPGTA